MPRKPFKLSDAKIQVAPVRGNVNLKDLAAYLGLSPTSLSIVLNNSPMAGSIPQETKDRIFAAAREFNYRPNYLARSLRAQRSHTVGVLVPELSDGYSSMVLSGVEETLLQNNFFYILASHRHRDDLIEHYPKLFIERCVEGIIAVDTPCRQPQSVPVIAVSGHDNAESVTNIVLNHEQAAFLALTHLKQLGHRKIAFIKGQVFSSDSGVRWEAIRQTMQKLDLPVNPLLVARLDGDLPSPELGYTATKKILANSEAFTAIFAFNDISAIGAIRALQENGRRVPDDISVIGFDDIYSAAFQNPALTTIRQPLFEMGKIAASTLLENLTNGNNETSADSIVVEPQLIIRRSTAAIPNPIIS